MVAGHNPKLLEDAGF